MKVKVLKPFVTGDARVHKEGEIIDLPVNSAKSLMKVGFVKQVIERAVSKPKKEKR
jgi:hypothetical protein